MEVASLKTPENEKNFETTTPAGTETIPDGATVCEDDPMRFQPVSATAEIEEILAPTK
jgi:hypothetical protein